MVYTAMIGNKRRECCLERLSADLSLCRENKENDMKSNKFAERGLLLVGCLIPCYLTQKRNHHTHQSITH